MKGPLQGGGKNAQGSLRTMLAAKPLHNVAAAVERDGTEGLRITVALEKRPYAPPLSWIVPARKSRSVVLEKLGAQIWALCDGEHTVENIVEEFAKLHRLTFHESRVAVAEHLRRLLQHGALAVAMPPTEHDRPQEPSAQ